MIWLICVCGGLGAMARYVLDVSIQRSWNNWRGQNPNVPISTLVINGIASLCAGIAMMSYYTQSVDIFNVFHCDQRGAFADPHTQIRAGDRLRGRYRGSAVDMRCDRFRYRDAVQSRVIAVFFVHCDIAIAISQSGKASASCRLPDLTATQARRRSAHVKRQSA